MNNYLVTTKGGTAAHIMRRLIHIAQVFYPIIYYDFGQQIAGWFNLSLHNGLLLILSVIILLEIIRLSFGLTIFGQREHEARQVSSFTWSAIAVVLVLMFAPGKMYAVPIIWGCALGDPFIGELRRMNWPAWLVFIAGVLFIGIIWWLCYDWLGGIWWLAILMAPITVLAEWPNWRWIDDNALMQLVPLLVLLAVLAI